MVFVTNTMVFVSGTMVPASESLVREAKIVVSKSGTILLAAGQMVSVLKKIFLLVETMVSRSGTKVFVTNTIFPTSDTTVPAAKKAMSVAPTMVRKVLSIGFAISEQGFAHPKLVFWGAPARSHHYLFGKFTIISDGATPSCAQPLHYYSY